MSAALLLLAERAKLYRAATPHGAYLDYLHDNGLGVASLAAPDLIADACGCMTVTTIRPTWDGSFEFVHPGERRVTVAAVIEAFGADNETVEDLVAWPVDDPSHVRRMFGRCDTLGAWNIASAGTYALGAPLRVWRTPLRWLQEGGTGCVVLDTPAAARRLAEAPGRISGEDREHSAELASLVQSLFDPTKFVAPVTDMQEAA